MDLTQQQADAVYDAIARKLTDYQTGLYANGLLSSTALTYPSQSLVAPYFVSTAPLYIVSDGSDGGTAIPVNGFTYITEPISSDLPTLPIDATESAYSLMGYNEQHTEIQSFSPYIDDIGNSATLAPLVAPMSDNAILTMSDTASVFATDDTTEYVDTDPSIMATNENINEQQEDFTPSENMQDDSFSLPITASEYNDFSTDNQQSSEEEAVESASLQESLKSAEMQTESETEYIAPTLHEENNPFSNDIDIRTLSQQVSAQTNTSIPSNQILPTAIQQNTPQQATTATLPTVSANQQASTSRSPQEQSANLRKTAAQNEAAQLQAQQQAQQRSNFLVRTGDWIQRNIFDRVGDWMPIGILGKAVKMVGNVFTGILKTVGHLFDGNWGNAGKTGLSWLKDTAIIGGTTVGVYALGKQFGWWGKSDTVNSTTASIADTTTVATASNTNTTLNTNSASLAMQTNTSQNATARLGTPVTLNESDATQSLIRNSQHTNG